MYSASGRATEAGGGTAHADRPCLQDTRDCLQQPEDRILHAINLRSMVTLHARSSNEAMPPRIDQTPQIDDRTTKDPGRFDSMVFRRRLRDTISTSIESHGRPLSSAEIYAICRSVFPDTELATIERAVRDLVTNGFLQPADTPGQSARYNVTIRPSPDDARRHLADMSEALSSVHTGAQPGLLCVALPGGLDRSLLKHQRFSVRTSNCLTAAGLFKGTDQVLVKDLLSIRNFGSTSLQDLLLVVEDYLIQCIDGASHRDRAPVDVLREPLSQLLAAASEFHGAASIADLLAPHVAQMASIIGVYDKLRVVGIDALAANHTRLSDALLTEAQQMYDTLTPTQRTVLDRRILASDTLKEVGNILGVTRERVRQVQAALVRRCRIRFGKELRTISIFLKAQLGAIVRERDVDSWIERLIVDDGRPGTVLARHALKNSLQYSRVTNGVCLDESASQVVDLLRRSAPSLAEDGIIDQARLKAILPDREWEQHWVLLLKCCAFSDAFGFLALRDSDRARTKAALLSIGAPSTREEIAELCGLSPAMVGSYLSGFPNVVRADKLRWGLSEWIDDEYEGIEAEIVQRIEEGGGVTTTNRLLKELPTKFGVSAASVSACLQRPTFSVHDNGLVTLDGTSSVHSPGRDLRIPHLPKEWKIQASLRCAAICGFDLIPRIVKGLLQIRDVSLLELYFHLEYAIKSDRLTTIIKTDYDHQVVKTAYAQFHEALLVSRRYGRHSSDKIEWIIPRDYTTNRQIDSSDAAAITDVLKCSFGSRVYSESIATDVGEWLPWMPLAVVKHLRTWRSSKINSLHRALFKLARDIDKTANACYPWEPTFSPEARFIPIQTLYQYETSSVTLGGINALRDCGLMSINDLRCLHPSAVAAAKNADQPLLRLYRSLDATD